jgi:hypothetical protein
MTNSELSVPASEKRWLRRVWDSVGLVSVGKFARQTCLAEVYGMNPSLRLDLGRVNGKLKLMSRNETMKMLILAPHAEPPDTRSYPSQDRKA